MFSARTVEVVVIIKLELFLERILLNIIIWYLCVFLHSMEVSIHGNNDLKKAVKYYIFLTNFY